MSRFEDAISYVLENEGVDSDDANDRGGRTRLGITHDEAARHGFDVTTLTREQACGIYRANYWKFDGIADQRLATKMLDVVINTGVSGGTKIIQRAIGVTSDGVYGQATESALNATKAEDAIERISIALADRYIAICMTDRTQLTFLRGWIHRAIRRPR